MIINEEFSESETVTDDVAIMITIPKTIKWSEYEKELETVKDGNETMFYKVSSLPKRIHEGSRCYICYSGKVVGWMTVDFVGTMDQFKCSTTGKDWSDGYYVGRTGEFHYLDNEYPQKGFMGYRYVNPSDFE